MRDRRRVESLLRCLQVMVGAGRMHHIGLCAASLREKAIRVSKLAAAINLIVLAQAANATVDEADIFRRLDFTGASQELYYRSGTKAVVLMTHGNVQKRRVEPAIVLLSEKDFVHRVS